jgi:hypothetical protein
MQVDKLIEKIKCLPPEKIAEVEAFVESLEQRSGLRAQTDHDSTDTAANEARNKADVLRAVADNI